MSGIKELKVDDVMDVSGGDLNCWPDQVVTVDTAGTACDPPLTEDDPDGRG